MKNGSPEGNGKNYSVRLFFIMIAAVSVFFVMYMLMGRFMISPDAVSMTPEEIYSYYHGKYSDVVNVYLPELDNGKLSKEDARLLTVTVFEYYYRCYDTEGDNVEPEGKLAALDVIRADVMIPVLYDRLGCTEDDMKAAKDDIMEYGIFHTDVAIGYSDR